MKNKLNLQFFAEPNPNPDPNPNPNPNPDPAPTPAKIEFSAEQQEHINKLINTAVAKTKSQMDAERLKYEEDKKRADELAKITDEKERKLKEYELKMADLEKEKAAMARERMTNRTMELLSEKKLPITMAKYLVNADEESTKTAIVEFEKSFLQAVADEVNIRLKGGTPSINPTNPNPIDVSKLSTEEYIRLRKENKI